jgi:predicted metal-dependent hydrolase
MYFLYIVQCRDGSLYTGITTDISRRIKEHNSSKIGAKYTRAKRPVRLVFVKDYPDRSEASVDEARIKKLTRLEKIRLIKQARKEYLARRRSLKKELQNQKAVQFQKVKEEARKVIEADVERLNKHYNFEYKNISIRNQSSRWGSCSSKKNLNFNFQLLFLAPEEREYVVVHELCHLQEMNHSKNFWSLVSIACPQYKTIRNSLKSRRIG